MIDSNVSLETVWGHIYSNLKELVSQQQYKTWFKSMRLRSCSDHTYAFTVPNNFLRDWISKYYLDVLRNAVKRATGDHDDFDIQLDIDSSTQENIDNHASMSPDTGDEPPVVEPRLKERPVKRNEDFFLNPNYVFDNFIVGPCNQLSYAACVAITENSGRPYNPLFIHGGSGLGKTHLLQAICHKALFQAPLTKIHYLSCETFINHFISAVEHGDLDNFRYKYRHIDLFLIDDVHLLANKGRTQEEFFHTFNSLYNSGKQIVLSSDSQPSSIPTLEERLVSRFKWGLVTDVDPPDFETRCAILNMKSRIKGYEVSEDVISFLAENIETNIRELEGAITKVIGYAMLMKQPLNIETACEAMKDVIKKDPRIVSIDHIVKTVTDKFGIKLSDLQSKRRNKSVALPRQIAMYIIKNATNHSLQDIGTYFGGRDHTTVLYAHKRIDSRVKSDEQFKTLVGDLMHRITSA